MKMSAYENTEQSILNVQHSILQLDMLRKLRLFLQYFLNVFGWSILFPILCIEFMHFMALQTQDGK